MGKRAYVVGDHWLDKRPDGKSPFWQIIWYDQEGRTTRYRSTGCERLDDAKASILAHVESLRAKAPQRPENAAVVPLLLLYWQEHGSRTIGPAQIASSIRQFIGFLMQDALGIAATVDQLKPEVFRRFIRWRRGPHKYALTWAQKRYEHSSPGVRGESVQRNLDDIRAALNHHLAEGRLPYTPKVPAVAREDRSPPRDRVLTWQEVGAIVGYAMFDLPLLRFVLSQIATAARPEVVLKWRPGEQANFKARQYAIHAPGAPVTKKRNPTVPLIDGFAPWLKASGENWIEHGGEPVRSMKRRWRTMRRVLGLSADVMPKTIRHTVATRLREYGVPAMELEGLLGHRGMSRTTAVYAKYDPAHLSAARDGLDRVWRLSWQAALRWLADHSRTTDKHGGIIIIAKGGENV